MNLRVKNKCGFTLVEVLIASALIALTIAPVLTSLLMGRSALQVAKHRSQAMQAARSHMDFLISKGYKFVNQLPYEYWGGYGLPLDPNGEEAGLTYNYNTVVTDDDADGLLEVTMQLQWLEYGLGTPHGRVVEEKLYFIYPPGKPN